MQGYTPDGYYHLTRGKNNLFVQNIPNLNLSYGPATIDAYVNPVQS